MGGTPEGGGTWKEPSLSRAIKLTLILPLTLALLTLASLRTL